MPITPKEWLEFAKKTVGTDEASNRSSASRAYYAAYHACLALSNSLPDPPPPPPKGLHDRAIRALSNCPIRGSTRERDKTVRKLGIGLGQLRDLRTRADYKVGEAFGANDSQQAISSCEDIFLLVDEIRDLDAKTP